MKVLALRLVTNTELDGSVELGSWLEWLGAIDPRVHECPDEPDAWEAYIDFRGREAALAFVQTVQDHTMDAGAGDIQCGDIQWVEFLGIFDTVASDRAAEAKAGEGS